MTPRVTPDTSTLVAGTIAQKGTSGQIISAWLDERVVFVTCEELIAEYQAALNRADIRDRYRHITPPTIAASVAGLRQFSQMVAIGEVPQIVKDPGDNVVLACAVTGSAEYIVTRDKVLLALESYSGIPIVTERAFLSILARRTREERVEYQITRVQSVASY